MINISFKTDDDLMARVIISKNYMPTNFINYLYYKYRKSYLILKRDITSKDIDDNIIYELKQQEFFKNFSAEASENLKRIKNNWETDKQKINDFVDKIFKKNFVLNLTSFIVSPSLNTGRNIENNQFIWGHIKGMQDKNYDLIYLVHESLHSYFKKTDLTYAVIENITDIELKKYLRNIEYTFDDCHEYIKMLHMKIQPFWNIYMNKQKKEIKKINRLNHLSYNLKSFEKYKTQIKNMNIDEFVEFMENLNLENLIFVKQLYSLNIKQG